MKLPNPNEMQLKTPGFSGPLEIRTDTSQEQATAELGRRLQGFSDVLMQKQHENDKYQVEDATNKLQKLQLDLSKGDNGYLNVHGENVAKDDQFYKNEQQKFSQGADEIAKSLTNDNQRKMFEKRRHVIGLANDSDLISHITRERDNYHEQTYKDGVVTNIDYSIKNFDNPGAIGLAEARIKNLTKSEADRLGGDYKTMVANNLSNLHSAVIKSALTNEQYDYARAWYDKNKKELTGPDQLQLKNLIQKGGIKQATQDAVDGYIAAGLDITEAKKKARAKFKNKPELRDAAIQRIDMRYGEIQKDRDAAQRDKGDYAWQVFANTKNLDNVPQEVLDGMDGRERIALENVAKLEASGNNVKTDPGTYYKLMQIAQANPVEFKKLNLMAYADKLSPPDRNSFMKMQTHEDELKTATSKAQILKEGASNAGIPVTQIKKGIGDEIEAYHRRVDAELQAYQVSHGKKPDNTEIRKITDRLSIDILKDPNAFIFKGKTKAWETEVPGVPSDMVDELAYRISQVTDKDGKPVPVTPENIQKLWKAVSGG